MEKAIISRSFQTSLLNLAKTKTVYIIRQVSLPDKPFAAAVRPDTLVHQQGIISPSSRHLRAALPSIAPPCSVWVYTPQSSLLGAWHLILAEIRKTL
jgi:hypothetical protein